MRQSIVRLKCDISEAREKSRTDVQEEGIMIARLKDAMLEAR